MAATDPSPACRQAASALNRDFLNVKQQAPVTLNLTGDGAPANVPISLGAAAPGPLVALGQYVEGFNAGVGALLLRPKRSAAALNTLLNHKSGDTATETAYTDCSNEIGLPAFFEMVARNSGAPDWAAIAASVHGLFSASQSSLTGFLYHWDKQEPVPAMFLVLSGLQRDPPAINNFRAAYNADGAKLAQIIRGEMEPICKWDGIVTVSQFERDHNMEKFQGFLHRLDQGKAQDAYSWLFAQVLGKDQASKDNFGACRKVDYPKVDCIAHKAFNREKDFDKCPVVH
jgi:hypothetical protein